MALVVNDGEARPVAGGDEARSKVFRAESLRRHRVASRRESTPLMIRNSTLVGLWTVVLLLAVAAAGFVLLLRAQLEDDGEHGAQRPAVVSSPPLTGARYETPTGHLPVNTDARTIHPPTPMGDVS